MTTSEPRQVECRYHGCGKPFASKHRLKEHVLYHLETDPPRRVFLHARIRHDPGGGFRVVEDMGATRTEDEKGEGSSRMVVDGDLMDEVRNEAAHGEEDEIDRFRISDIIPSDSQVGNITTTTTTTTTTGGTTSQPITFSPYLPDRPSQISLPTQSQSPLRVYRSQPESSPLVQLSLNRSHRHASVPREPSTPFVHTAPSGSGAASPRSNTRHLASTSRSVSVPGSPQSVPRSVSRHSPFNLHSPLQSSTPLDQREMLLPLSQSQSQPPQSQIVPPSAQPHQSQVSSSRQNWPSGPTRKSLSFGDALTPAKKSRTTIDTDSPVTFGFGS